MIRRLRFCLTIFNLFGAVMPKTAIPVDIIGGLDVTLNLDLFYCIWGLSLCFCFAEMTGFNSN